MCFFGARRIVKSQLPWRLISWRVLSEKAAQDENKLDKAVAKMFKDFPPGDAELFRERHTKGNYK
jgi:hypothetical protein